MLLSASCLCVYMWQELHEQLQGIVISSLALHAHTPLHTTAKAEKFIMHQRTSCIQKISLDCDVFLRTFISLNLYL